MNAGRAPSAPRWLWIAVGAIALIGPALLLSGLPGAAWLDLGSMGLALSFAAQIVIVAALAVELYGPRPAVAAAAIDATLILALRESGLQLTDLASSAAFVLFLAVVMRCLLDPRIEYALLAAAAFAWLRQTVPPSHVVAVLATAIGARVVGATPHERRARLVHAAIVAAAIVAGVGSAIGALLGAWAPSLSTALAPQSEPTMITASAFPSILVLLLARPWRHHRIYGDGVVVGALAVLLLAVLPCREAAPWPTCVGSTAQARALVLAMMPLLALLAAANWTHERPAWWRWIASGLLAVATFQSIAG